MVKRRGRKPIGQRQSFACPDELYDYIYWHGKEHGLDDWADAIRHLIRDHLRKIGTEKTHVIETTRVVQ